ncbi:MAG TPA: hypothetical protein VMZ11_00010 [Mycobacteriales bacterium]|nr:hypothetical protein [Mycobacteriales bacterium]
MAGGAGQVLHLLMLVVWVPALLAWWPLDRAWREQGGSARLALVGGIVGLSYFAGLVHVVALPAHARESALFGAFFAVAAAAQLGYAVVLARHPSRRVLEVGALGQLALVVLWALTRTVGLPVGPERWHAEPVAFLDLSCVLSEAAAVLLSLWLLGRAVEEPDRLPRSSRAWGQGAAPARSGPVRRRG